MSFSKRILNNIEQDRWWKLQNSNKKEDLYKFHKNFNWNDFIVDYILTEDNLIWLYKEKIENIYQRAVLSCLSDYYYSFRQIPSIKEFDYYLRDSNNIKPWPSDFNITGITNLLQILKNDYIRYSESKIPCDKDEFVDWVSNQLSSTGHEFKVKLDSSLTKLFIQGAKEDAHWVEELLCTWEESFSQKSGIKDLVLLYVIKS